MERTYSQKVARAFEIADYILLFPAGFGALLATLIFSGFTLLVYAFFIAGVVLLVGYYKHSRGKLDESYFSALWVGTAVYNFILLLPCLYWASALLQSRTEGDGQIVIFLAALSIVLGYIAAIVSSIKANTFEKRKKYL